MNLTELQVIMDRLTPADVTEIPFRSFELVRKSLIDDAEREFRRQESRLEELSRAAGVDSKEGLDQERRYALAKMEEQILRLRLFRLEVDAYILVAKYAKICQQYGLPETTQSA